MEKRKIFVLGSLNMDLVMQIDKMPEKGETVKGRGFMTNPGGKGANQAVACGKLGATVKMIGMVGNDSFGEILKESLKMSHVDAGGVLVSQNQPTGTAIVLLEEGDNRIIINAGANADQNVPFIKKYLTENALKGDYLVTQLEIPVPVLLETYKVAKEIGMYILLNPAPASNLPKEIYQYIDILVPNETEVKVLTGIAPVNNRNLMKIQNHFKALDVKEVLITLGENGSVYLADGLINYFSAYKTKVVDTTAAGDTFIGAFVTRLSIGCDPDKAIDYASRAASITVSRMGAQISIPTIDDMISYIKD